MDALRKAVSQKPIVTDDQVSFHFDTEAAISDGCRACKRCRPDSRPGSPAWSGTLATVRRGKRYIESSFLDHHIVQELAAKLGVDARHLTRLVVQHEGCSLVKLAQRRRVQIAIRLLKANTMSATRVAFASGFGSLHEFNSTFIDSTVIIPTQFRQKIQPKSLKHALKRKPMRIYVTSVFVDDQAKALDF